MNKKELRSRYDFIRANIKDRDKQEKQIALNVQSSLEYINADTICLYLSFGSEVSTTAIIIDALDKGKKVGIPVINGVEMDFYNITSLSDIKHVNAFGIGEPLNNIEKLILPSTIDLIIVPGLCFDSNNNRLGFGKGYYDKYLSNRKVGAVKMGICFKEQILDKGLIEVLSSDVKMDMIISS